jgi:hypothetical protein
LVLANRRKDRNQQITARLCAPHKLIVTEDLAPSNMTANDLLFNEHR